MLEKATNRVVVEADLGWLDIGDWAAMYSAAPRDAAGNAAARRIDRGRHARHATLDRRPGKVVAAIGLEDVVVVDTEDALLVARARPRAGRHARSSTSCERAGWSSTSSREPRDEVEDLLGDLALRS